MIFKKPPQILKEAKILIDKWDFSINNPLKHESLKRANDIAEPVPYYDFLKLLDTLEIGETLPPQYFALYNKGGSHHLFTNFKLIDPNDGYLYSYNIIDLERNHDSSVGWLENLNFGLRFHNGGRPGRESPHYRFFVLKDRHNFLNWSINPF
tara:strand:+ start:74 stop:529 length:456 start_codon:yes stop_codon:yes gene_type:complete